MSTGIEALRQQARDMGTASDGTFMTMRTGDVRAAIAAHDDALAALAGARAAQQELERQAVAAGEQLSEAQARLADAERKHDRACDSHYAAGMLAGWNYCVRNAGDEFNEHRMRLIVACGEDRRAHAAEKAAVKESLTTGAADPAAQIPEGWVTLGVGNGDGNLFVYGPYEAIKECQRKLLAAQAPAAPAAQQPHRLKETSVVQSNNSAGPLSTQADTRAAAVERAAELAGRVAGEETANTIRHAGIVIGTNNECPTCKRY